MKEWVQSRREAVRIARFVAAGIVNTAFGYGVYALFVMAGCGVAPAVVLSTIAGILFNYRTLGSVFGAQGTARLPRFIAVYAVTAPLNIVLVGLAERAGTGPYLGGALALSVVVPLTYLAMRSFVFAPGSVPDRLA